MFLLSEVDIRCNHFSTIILCGVSVVSVYSKTLTYENFQQAC